MGTNVATVVRTNISTEPKNIDPSNADALDLEMGISFAVHAHAGQTLSNGGPYVLHPLRMMQALLDTGDYYLALLGVLHDTVEHTAATFEEIEEIFGRTVREDIDALTRREGEEYFEFIHRISTNLRAARVSLAAISDYKRLSFTHPLAFEVQYSQGSRHDIARGILNDAIARAARAN